MHSTRFTEPRMSTRHQCEASTWRHEAHFAVVAAAAVADYDVPEVIAAGTGAYLSSSSSSLLLLLLLLLSCRGCRDSVWAPTEWPTARRNCRRGDCKRRCRIVTNRI